MEVRSSDGVLCREQISTFRLVAKGLRYTEISGTVLGRIGDDMDREGQFRSYVVFFVHILTRSKAARPYPGSFAMRYCGLKNPHWSGQSS